MIVYLDTSVVIGRLLGQSPALASWGSWNAAYASTLMRVEFARTMDRLRLDGQIGDAERASLQQHFEVAWEAIHRIPMSPAILDRAAGPYPVVLGTLDALHLASALDVLPSLEEPMTFLTHDRQLGQGAESVGLRVDGA